VAVATRRQPAITLDLLDFSGGLNARDGYAEVAPNELRDGTLNWTLDERAAIAIRKPCVVAADFPTLPGNPTTLYYCATLNLMIVQVGTTLYKCAPGGGSWVSFSTASISSTPVAFCDFHGYLLYVDQNAGVISYNGTTQTLIAPSPSGTAIAVWQNKVWVGGGRTGGTVPVRLYWSAAGNATFATATDYVDLSEKDDKPITALFGGPTLVAFKETSHYRINDSSTGAFTTIDWNAGAVGARAVIGGVAPQASGLIQEGGIFFWGLDGLYAGDGLRPAILVGDKLRPRFLDYAKINSTTKPFICSGVANGRIYFGFPKTSTIQPDTILEYHPRDKWLLEHQVGSSKPYAFASYPTVSRQVTVFANGSATSLIELMKQEAVTAIDYDGSSIAATLKTGFLSIAEGRLVRMRKAVFTITAAASSAVTFAASYLDANLGTELSDGLSWGAKTLPAGTSETSWNATGRAPAFSFTLTTSDVLVTLRRILAKFYPTEF